MNAYRHLQLNKLVAWLLLSTFPLFAQGGAEACNVVFSQGIKDLKTVSTGRESAIAYRSRLCTVSFSSYQQYKDTATTLGLNVPIGDALIGLSGSDSEKSGQFAQKYDAFCKADYFASDYRERYDSYLSQINSALLMSWNRCQELYLQPHVQKVGAFAFLQTPTDFDKFTVEVLLKSAGTGAVKIKSINPSGRVSCSRGGVLIKPNDQIDSLQFVLSCEKNADDPIPFTIEVDTLGLTPAIEVPARTSKMAELLVAMEEYRTQIRELKNQVSNTISAAEARLRAEIPNAVNVSAAVHDSGFIKGPNAEVSCQAGQVMTTHIAGTQAYEHRVKCSSLSLSRK